MLTIAARESARAIRRKFLFEAKEAASRQERPPVYGRLRTDQDAEAAGAFVSAFVSVFAGSDLASVLASGFASVLASDFASPLAAGAVVSDEGVEAVALSLLPLGLAA